MLKRKAPHVKTSFFFLIACLLVTWNCREVEIRPVVNWVKQSLVALSDCDCKISTGVHHILAMYGKWAP